MDQITPSTRENEKSGNRVARNCRSCRLPRQSTIRVTLDTYTQAIATEKRNAQDPWSRCCSEERRKNQALPGRRLYRVYLFCVLVWLRQKRNVSYTFLDCESRGDGLEPSASAVTANRAKVSQQLARSRDRQTPRKSCKTSHSVGTVVGGKTFKDCPRPRLIVVPILNYRLLFAHNDSGAKWLRRSSAVIMLNGTRRRAEFAA